MCLEESQKVPLELTRAVREAAGHFCFEQCPVCWLFAHYTTYGDIVQGREVRVGPLSQLMIAGAAGCRFAASLVVGLTQQAGDNELPIGSEVSAQLPPDADEWTELRVSVRTRPTGEIAAPSLGPGYSIQAFGNYATSIGIFLEKNEHGLDFVPGRLANPFVSSPESFATARKWIAECLACHGECPGKSFWTSAPLPTRLIDVGLNDPQGTVKLRTSLPGERSDGMAGYVALSYVWGESESVQQYKTTKVRLPSLCRSIDPAVLPKTIQEAIHATRELGIPYLWVDALCIVQDDDEDRSRELASMAQIYRHATVTISAASAENCEDGFLEPRRNIMELRKRSFHLPFRLPGQQNNKRMARLFSRFGLKRLAGKYGRISLCPDPSLGHELTPETGYHDLLPINNRGWTMQESWLSPRLLTYGLGALQWKCVSREAFEGQKRNEIRDFMTMLTNQRARFFPPRTDLDGKPARPRTAISAGIKEWTSSVDAIEMWKSLVTRYMGRDLTHSSDRLPAISGMAAEFGRICGYQYWAGLWSHDLESQLLWQHAGSTRALPTNYRAPSWSWAAVEGEVSFLIEATVAYPRHPKEDTPMERRVSVHDCSVQLNDPLQPFGEVAHGELTLCGPVRTLPWVDIRHNFDFFAAGVPNYYNDYIVLDGGMESRIWEMVTTEISEEVASGKVPDNPLKLHLLELTRDGGPAGLVLMERDDGKYERVAYFRLGSLESLENSGPEHELRGFRNPPRDWEWDVDQHLTRLTIV